MAAMMAIGMPLPEDKKVYNLTQLRRNCRPKHQKKCGTKKGRKGDTEMEQTINPAPDSVVKSAQKSDIFNTPVHENNTQTLRPNSIVKKSLFDVTLSPKPLINSTPKTPRSILKSKSSYISESGGKKRKLQFFDETSLKKQKIKADLSDISENSDFVEFENSRDEIYDMPESPKLNIQWWIEELQLTIEDKSALLKGGKLNSHHMEAVNKILRKQVGSSIHGLQLTEKVPFFNDTENRWITKFPFDPIEQSPACQIHHTHSDHWVVSLFHHDQLYLLDSLGIERNIDRIIPDGLKLQLSQIYSRKVKSLSLNLSCIMKQNNSC
jgi:stress-induced morphogen